MFGMDVDGVLTDAGIYYGDSELEIKRFNAQDGMGVTLLLRAGIVPFIITARTSSAVARRARELGIEEVHQGVTDKLSRLKEVVARQGVELAEVAFIGDDLSDLAVLKQVGLPIAVANAVDEVRCTAKFMASCNGGDGAVREACEYVIKLNGYEGPMSGLLESQSEPGEASG
jgi:YrbI family 3-deoxy-D-manno-octulosonate 8-phosphate phosphatase